MGTRRRAIRAASRKRHGLGTLRATHNQARIPGITRGFLRNLRVIFRETLRPPRLAHRKCASFMRFERSEAVLGRFWRPPQTLSLARPCIFDARPRSAARSLSRKAAHVTIPRLPHPNAKDGACWDNVKHARQRENKAHHGHVRYVCSSVYVGVGRDALLPTPGWRAGSLSTIPHYECMAGRR